MTCFEHVSHIYDRHGISNVSFNEKIFVRPVKITHIRTLVFDVDESVGRMSFAQCAVAGRVEANRGTTRVNKSVKERKRDERERKKTEKRGIGRKAGRKRLNATRVLITQVVRARRKIGKKRGLFNP